MAQAELAQPVDQALHAPLPDRELRERAAEHDRDSVCGVPLQLGRQVGADQSGAPAELYDVDAPPRHLEQALHLRHREAAVDHVREAALARLGRAGWDVEEVGYGPVAALSRPTMTTTVAEPDSDATPASIGCG